MGGTIELTPEPSAPSARGDDFDLWFERDYPLVVGLCRRILDLGAAVDASLELAEDIAVDVFARAHRARARAEDQRTVALIELALDECLEHMVGHPGTVALHPELLGTDIDFDGLLPLDELQETLADMRRSDRRVGLLTLGAGYSPSEVAILLEQPLDEVLARLARISVRLADARRVGTAESDRSRDR